MVPEAKVRGMGVAVLISTTHTSTNSSENVSALLLSVAAQWHSDCCSFRTLWQLEVPLAKVMERGVGGSLH
jgi:hypothetical protein